MKKILIAMLIIILALLLCILILNHIYQKDTAANVDPVEKDLETIEKIAETFEDKLVEVGVEKEMVDEVIEKIEEYNKTAKHVIEFEVQNESVALLRTTVHLPVDKEFYDSVEIGDNISKEVFEQFQQLDQTLDGWVITVKDKMVRE